MNDSLFRSLSLSLSSLSSLPDASDDDPLPPDGGPPEGTTQLYSTALLHYSAPLYYYVYMKIARTACFSCDWCTLPGVICTKPTHAHIQQTQRKKRLFLPANLALLLFLCTALLKRALVQDMPPPVTCVPLSLVNLPSSICVISTLAWQAPED